MGDTGHGGDPATPHGDDPRPSPPPAGTGAGAARNVQRGRADTVVQARDIHGDVHLGLGRRTLLWAGGLLGAAVLAASVVVSWPDRSDPPDRPAPAGTPQSAGPSPTSTTPPVAPPALRVTADLSANDEGPWGYVADSPTFPGADLLAALAQPRAPTNPALAAQVRTAPGAYAARRQVIRLHLEGPADHAARVTAIRPVVHTVRPVPRGTLLSASAQGTGAEESAQVMVVLDDPFPAPREVLRGDEGVPYPGEPYFPAHTINLTDGGTSEVVVLTTAVERAYEYDLVVVYQVGDELRETVVDDDGEPFRISGEACSDPGTFAYDAVYTLAGEFSLQRATPSNDPYAPIETDCAR